MLFEHFSILQSYGTNGFSVTPNVQLNPILDCELLSLPLQSPAVKSGLT